MTRDSVANLISKVLQGLYQSFWAAIVLTFFVMIAFFTFEKHGIKETIKLLWKRLKDDADYRIKTILVFYVSMILFRTVLARQYWVNPLSDVIGSFGLTMSKGQVYTENVENLLLFIPFGALICLSQKKKSIADCLWTAVKASSLFSFGIEFAQFVFKLGTFQLSDLAYNALGGLFGGIICWLWVLVEKKTDSVSDL